MTLSNEIKKLSDFSTTAKSSLPAKSALLDSSEVERSILALLGMLYPMAPHFVSELWELWKAEVQFDLPAAPTWPSIEDSSEAVVSQQTVVVQVPANMKVFLWDRSKEKSWGPSLFPEL